MVNSEACVWGRRPAAPKSSGPYDPVPDDDVFTPAPFRTKDVAIHLSGGLLNGVACLLALTFLVSNGGMLLTGFGWVLLAIAVATFVADFVSGMLHWAFDTWFDENTTSVRRMVIMVREHHIYPQRIFRYGLKQEAGMLSWFALPLAVPLFGLAVLPDGPPTVERYALAAAGVIFTLEISFMLEFHKVGHRFQRGPVIRALQRLHLLLSPEHHMRHHAREHDTNYCLINGVADLTLGRLRVFRGLEHVVAMLTGKQPRSNDREWRRRYGRWVATAAPPARLGRLLRQHRKTGCC